MIPTVRLPSASVQAVHPPVLERHVPDRRVLDLLRQYVHRTIDDDGL